MAKRYLGLITVLVLSSRPAYAAATGGAATSPPPPPTIVEPASGMELILVKGGCFQMGNIYRGEGEGDDDDVVDGRPAHDVCVGDFYIGKFEVTRRQWLAVMGRDPSNDETCVGLDCPVTEVSWDAVQLFIRRINAKAGRDLYRLPTEAEWEYAARSGGKRERYSGGNDPERFAWYAGNSGFAKEPPVPIVHKVGTRAPNGLGLHDMSGNVYELIGDWFDPTYYSSSPKDDPTGPASPPTPPNAAGPAHVRRGGCASGQPANVRTVRRNYFAGPGASTGLRLSRPSPSGPAPR